MVTKQKVKPTKKQTKKEPIDSNVFEIITQEEAEDKLNSCEGGRTVIIRGKRGELLLNSSDRGDTLDYMVRVALEEYDKQEIPSYIG